jgi:hypothetical protein
MKCAKGAAQMLSGNSHRSDEQHGPAQKVGDIFVSTETNPTRAPCLDGITFAWA